MNRATQLTTVGRRVLFGVALTVAGALLPNCGEDDEKSCPVGSEGCDCTPGGSCDPGLSCYSNVCVVDEGTGGTAGVGGQGTGGGAGTGGSTAGTGGDGGGGTGGGGAGTGGADTGGTGGGDAGAAGSSTGGSAGSATTPANYDMWSCAGTECCLTTCEGNERCGWPSFSDCVDAGSCYAACPDDTIVLPAWYEERQCVLTWAETQMVLIMCPCEDGGQVLTVNPEWFKDPLDCDFSAESEPDCASVDFSVCQ